MWLLCNAAGRPLQHKQWLPRESAIHRSDCDETLTPQLLLLSLSRLFGCVVPAAAPQHLRGRRDCCARSTDPYVTRTGVQNKENSNRSEMAAA